MEHRAYSHIRTLRRKSTLNQSELASLLGKQNAAVVSRAEDDVRVPSLSVALAWGAVFGRPTDELFPKLKDEIEEGVLERANMLSRRLHKHGDPNTPAKLEFLEQLISRLDTKAQAQGV